MEDLERQIEQLGRGDTDSLEAIYHRAKSAVYGLALSIVRNREDAEDIMQDSFLNVYRAAPRYQAKGKPMAWILRITRNLALDRLRAKSATELPLEAEKIKKPKGDLSQDTLDRMILNTALERLSEEERQIVILHSVEQFKHKEIAEILEIPLGTALSKYHRALSKLKKILEEDET